MKILLAFLITFNIWPVTYKTIHAMGCRNAIELERLRWQVFAFENGTVLRTGKRIREGIKKTRDRLDFIHCKCKLWGEKCKK